MTSYKEKEVLSLADIDTSERSTLKILLTGKPGALKKAETDLKKKTSGYSIYPGSLRGKDGLVISYDYSAQKVDMPFLHLHKVTTSVFNITGCNLGVELVMCEPVAQNKIFFPLVALVFEDDERRNNKELMENNMSVVVSIIESKRARPFGSIQNGGQGNHPSKLLYEYEQDTHKKARIVTERLYEESLRSLGMYEFSISGPKWEDPGNGRPGRT